MLKGFLECMAPRACGTMRKSGPCNVMQKDMRSRGRCRARMSRRPTRRKDARTRAKKREREVSEQRKGMQGNESGFNEGESRCQGRYGECLRLDEVGWRGNRSRRDAALRGEDWTSLVCCLSFFFG